MQLAYVWNSHLTNHVKNARSPRVFYSKPMNSASFVSWDVNSPNVPVHVLHSNSRSPQDVAHNKNIIYNYSRTSLMWTPKGRAKSLHNSEVSTVTKRVGKKVSTVPGCPQKWGVHRAGFYCISLHIWVFTSMQITPVWIIHHLIHPFSTGHLTSSLYWAKMTYRLLIFSHHHIQHYWVSRNQGRVKLRITICHQFRKQ